MSRKLYRIFVVAIAAGCLMGLPSCGHDQKISKYYQVQPSTVTFLRPFTGLTVQLTALGTYIHPPATKDITNQVVWKSDDSQIVTVSSAGAVTTPGFGACGLWVLPQALRTVRTIPGGT